MEEWKEGWKEGSREGRNEGTSEVSEYVPSWSPSNPIIEDNMPLLTLSYPHGYLPHIDMIVSFDCK